MADPLDWCFDVTTADHDAVKTGVLVEVTSRVVLSDMAFPTLALARDTAACVAVAVHGGMATSVRLAER